MHWTTTTTTNYSSSRHNISARRDNISIFRLNNARSVFQSATQQHFGFLFYS